MKPKKQTYNELLDKLDLMEDKEVAAVGSYIYNGFHVQISEYKLSGAERVSRLYYRRREKGLCIICGKKVNKKNHLTKKLYRLCDKHREEIDHKKNGNN